MSAYVLDGVGGKISRTNVFRLEKLYVKPKFRAQSLMILYMM